MKKYILTFGIISLGLTGLAYSQGMYYNSPISYDQVTALIQASLPVPASAVPQPEVIGGAIGNSSSYMRADAKLPRITRATTVTTASDGTFTGTWTTPTAANPTIVLTPIGSSSLDCQLSSVPTTTTFSGKCWVAQSTFLNLALITSSLTLNPVVNAGAGVQVQVIALPPTQ